MRKDYRSCVTVAAPAHGLGPGERHRSAYGNLTIYTVYTVQGDLMPKTKSAVAPSASAADTPAAKPATKAPAKRAAKPVAKPAAKPAAKAAAKPAKPAAKAAKPAAKAAKPTVKAAKAAAKAAPTIANAAAPAAKPAKPPKAKLVRDSFTIPKDEYQVLDRLKSRALGLGQPIKKGELLRAGILALAAMSDAAFVAAIAIVPTLKTGRPKAD
ncbi:MAG: hypothetical protein ABJD97_02190 [Betaproteobacteria bacterium]